ncbi:MAG: heavy-metal-associated domain-containing protein, partial [Anaerolineales bacterium]|nr:heavy-metal-associated domain-containing protein [Anaerolineales bacterium]
MSEDAQITLPVLGMTCANCVASVERNAKKVEGVHNATVNYASEKVSLDYDPQTTDIQLVVERIGRAGYKVPTATVELPITGMTC